MARKMHPPESPWTLEMRLSYYPMAGSWHLLSGLLLPDAPEENHHLTVETFPANDRYWALPNAIKGDLAIVEQWAQYREDELWRRPRSA